MGSLGERPRPRPTQCFLVRRTDDIRVKRCVYSCLLCIRYISCYNPRYAVCSINTVVSFCNSSTSMHSINKIEPKYHYTLHSLSNKTTRIVHHTLVKKFKAPFFFLMQWTTDKLMSLGNNISTNTSKVQLIRLKL